MEIPVYFKSRKFSEPASSLYYLAAANGYFLVNRTPLFASVTEARSVPGLLDQERSIELRFPKLPRKLMERVYGFFRAVYELWEGEAVVFFYYAPERDVFRVAVPPQTLFRYRYDGRWRTERRVAYGYHPRPEGFVKLGDAHSHADFPAFFSCKDDTDDREDGLRVILGNLHHARPDVSASFVANGTRFILAPGDVAEEFSVPLTPPEAWLERVTCRREVSTDGQESEATEDGEEWFGSGKDCAQN